MAQKPWKTETIKVADLFLDEQNIRLDLETSTPSQDALIHDLFINQEADDLAKSIAAKGLFQHELPIVIKEGKRLVVVEGNRRIAALKALFQPSLVPSFAPRLEQMKKTSDFLPITVIDVKVAPSRVAVMQLLAAIHTTQSRKRWSRLRQAYFYYAQIQSKTRTLEQLVSDFPDVDVPRFVRMWEMHRIARSLTYPSPEEAAKVADQENFPITTLERIYDTDAFRKAFRVRFDENGKVTIQSERASFEQSFKHIVQDIINDVVTSRTHNKSDDIKRYVNSLDKPKPAEDAKTLKAEEFKPVEPPKKERKAKGLAPKDLTCGLNSPGIKRVLKELQTLDYTKYPNAAHDLLRSFLECSLKAYFAHKNISVPRRRSYIFLNDVLELAESHFQTENKSLVQPIRVLRASAGNSTKNYLCSEDYLNALNHNPATFSSGDQVKEAWDRMEDIIRHILNP